KSTMPKENASVQDEEPIEDGEKQEDNKEQVIVRPRNQRDSLFERYFFPYGPPILLSVIILSVLAIFIGPPSPEDLIAHVSSMLDSPSPQASSEITRAEFGRIMNSVEKEHPEITERDRMQLRAAANRWFDSSSLDPVVVIIYASESSSKLLDDFTTATSSFLGQDLTVINASEDTERAFLHETFERTLSGGSKSTIGIRRPEKLPWEAALVLHAFADGDYVAASRPLIWLQVTRDDTFAFASCDEAIESILMKSWTSSGGTEGNVAPIISRVLQFTVCLDWQ
ncbi:hypothetical protein PMAYCL1PPCAC_13182, partial [Pristionchus mayeri]